MASQSPQDAEVAANPEVAEEHPDEPQVEEATASHEDDGTFVLAEPEEDDDEVSLDEEKDEDAQTHDDDDDDDDDDDHPRGKKRRRRVRRRRKKPEDEAYEEAPVKTRKKKSKGEKKKPNKIRKRSPEQENDYLKDANGRYTYEAAPTRPELENILPGPHQALEVNELKQGLQEALASIRLPLLSPSCLTDECWDPEWSVTRELALRQARYSYIQYQSKHPDVAVDFNQLAPYDLHPKALRVARLPNGEDAPRLVPNSWLAQWSDGTMTVHVGKATTLSLGKSMDKCVLVNQSRGRAKIAEMDSIYENDETMENDRTDREPEDVDVFFSQGVVDEKWIAKLSTNDNGFEQRQNRLRDILRRSAGSKKTVQLLNLDEIAQMTNAQKRQDEARASDQRYKRRLQGKKSYGNVKLNAAYLDEDDEFDDESSE